MSTADDRVASNYWIAPGIYLHMPEAEYHADLALGSSSIRDLLLTPTDYWYESPLNELRDEVDIEDDSSAAKTRGSAFHKLVLEGQDAFDALYVCGPKPRPGMTSGQKAAATKAAKADMEESMPHATLLPYRDYCRVRIMAQMVTADPELAGAFRNGLPELSVFWEHITPDGEPVRCKARFDYLKPRGIGDLKTISTWDRTRAFEQVCIDAIKYRYYLQPAHYLEGRTKIAEFLKEGRVYGVKENREKLILGDVAAAREWAFMFVFIQATRSPVTFSKIITPHKKNPVYQRAVAHRATAIQNYLRYSQEHAKGEPWVRKEKPSELSAEDVGEKWLHGR